MSKQVMKATFLTRNVYGEIIKVQDRYEGNVPVKLLEHLAQTILEMNQRGSFYPLDAMDIYQKLYLKLEQKSMKLPELNEANSETYLSGVLRLQLLEDLSRNVDKNRQEHEQVMKLFDKLMSHQLADADDTLRDVAESLAYDPETMTQEKARRIINDTLPRLKPETRTAFLAYLQADGNFVIAARLSHISKKRYYRDFPKWKAEFKAKCVWFGEDEK